MPSFTSVTVPDNGSRGVSVCASTDVDPMPCPEVDDERFATRHRATGSEGETTAAGTVRGESSRAAYLDGRLLMCSTGLAYNHG